MASIIPIVREALANGTPIAAAIQKVIDAKAADHPHADWEKFRAMRFDDLADLQEWIEFPLRNEPPGIQLAGLWFGLTNPVRGGKATADIYVSGCNRFDPNPGDNSWAVRPAWWPDGRYAGSSMLDAIYQLAYQSGGLGNRAEYALGLSYGALAVRDLLAEIDPALVLGSSDAVGVGVGFDSGDFLLVGQLTRSGLAPCASPKRT